MKQGSSTAAMDPWLLLEGPEGELRLFGYCLTHHRLGGRSWAVSSGIVHLDIRAGIARTESKTTYLLGARIDAADLPDEESRIALDALVLRPGSATDETRAWLASQKMARWVGVQPPDRSNPFSVEAFLARYTDAYLAARDAAAPQGGTAGGAGAGRGFAEPSKVAPIACPNDGAMLQASYKGASVVVARADRAELAGLVEAGSREAIRDKLDDWCLVAIRGLPQGTKVHALGRRAQLEDVWITSAIARIGHRPLSVATASGHSYVLGSPQGEALDPRLRRHLDFALASWGFEGVRPP